MNETKIGTLSKYGVDDLLLEDESIKDLINRITVDNTTTRGYAEDRFEKLRRLTLGLVDIISNFFDPSVVPQELLDIRSELTSL